MQDDFENNQEDYCSLTHEDWCEILSTIEVKDNRKMSATQIRKIASAREASHYDRDKSISVPRNKKSRTGALINITNRKAPKLHGNQSQLMLLKKAGFPKQKYMLHITEECFGKLSDQNSIRYGLGGIMGSRDEAVKQYKKSKTKWNKGLKDIKKHKRRLAHAINK